MKSLMKPALQELLAAAKVIGVQPDASNPRLKSRVERIETEIIESKPALPQLPKLKKLEIDRARTHSFGIQSLQDGFAHIWRTAKKEIRSLHVERGVCKKAIHAGSAFALAKNNMKGEILQSRLRFFQHIQSKCLLGINSTIEKINGDVFVASKALSPSQKGVMPIPPATHTWRCFSFRRKNFPKSNLRKLKRP